MHRVDHLVRRVRIGGLERGRDVAHAVGAQHQQRDRLARYLAWWGKYLAPAATPAQAE